MHLGPVGDGHSGGVRAPAVAKILQRLVRGERTAGRHGHGLLLDGHPEETAGPPWLGGAGAGGAWMDGGELWERRRCPA